MRITMMTIGSTGDVQPLLLLGREMASRGHAVTMAVMPGFRQTVLDAGLAFHPIAGDAEDFMKHIMKPGAVGPAYLRQVSKSVSRMAPMTLESMEKAAKDTDLLVCSFFGSVYYSVAEQAGIPCVQIQYWPMDPNPDVPMSSAPFRHLGPAWNRFTYRAGYLLISMLEKKLLDRWRRENGLALRGLYTKPDYRAGRFDVPVIYALSEALLPRPAAWGDNIRVSGCWASDDGEDFVPDEALSAFLAEGPAPLYIGFGSMNSGDMRQIYQTAVDAVEQAGLRAVVSTGWADAEVTLPHSGRVRVLSSQVPHSWLFSRVSAVVHHGGAGTTMTGLRHGRPTLIIPFGGDQAFWGDRVHAIGCGPKAIPRTKATAGLLAAAMKDLAGNPAYAEKAAAVGERMRGENGVRLAAGWIEEFAEQSGIL